MMNDQLLKGIIQKLKIIECFIQYLKCTWKQNRLDNTISSNRTLKKIPEFFWEAIPFNNEIDLLFLVYLKVET